MHQDSQVVRGDAVGKGRRSSLLLILLAAVSVLPSASAWAISLPHPESPRKLTVQGKIVGNLRKGGDVRFAIVATDPSGWFDLSTVSILLLLHEQPVQEITFEVDTSTLTTTGQPPVHFPGVASLPGSFLEVFHDASLAKKNVVELVRQTFSVSLNISTKVREAIPGSIVVRVTAVNRDGDVSTARVRAAVKGGLLSWGTLALAAGVALFLGGLVGNTFTHRRYRQREPSIWDIVERRLKEQRVRPPAPVLAGDER
jgi:hypothetical protein